MYIYMILLISYQQDNTLLFQNQIVYKIGGINVSHYLNRVLLYIQCLNMMNG
jgi:hypothetical protein